MSLTSVDAAFSSLTKFFSNGGGGSVDASCDLVSALRHMAPPVTNVVQYKKDGTMLGLESGIRYSTSEFFMAIRFISLQCRESVERCKTFLESHRYSLLEIYSDFEDLIRKVPKDRIEEWNVQDEAIPIKPVCNMYTACFISFYTSQ